RIGGGPSSTRFWPNAIVNFATRSRRDDEADIAERFSKFDHRFGYRSGAPQNLKFEREDWTSFRTVEGLQQKAGVPAHKPPTLVLKELTDNALDAGGQVRVGKLPDGGYFVEDDGGGITGTPTEIARLFSISRPLVSTKLLRLPQRGALGNGPP